MRTYPEQEALPKRRKPCAAQDNSSAPDPLEKALGRSAVKNLLPMQPGDVPATYADIDDLEAAVGFRPRTSIEEGVRRFVDWYRTYYGG